MTSTIEHLQTTLEPRISPWITGKDNINLVIGAVQGEQHQIAAWGTLQSSGKAVDETTLFEIGSLTKLFTTTLLAILVEQGQLTLEMPVNQLGTAYEKLPDTITLESLATHTSGLPRLPSNLVKSLRENPHNPYKAYTVQDLEEYLQTWDNQPGKTTGIISYSNLGVGLLGHILTEVLGQSYEDAIAQYICNPLSLSDTCITLNPEQQQRFAQGYNEGGKPVQPWDLPTLAGAGALRSTATDLLTFMAAHWHSPSSALLNTRELRYQEFAPNSGLFGIVEKLGKWVQKWRGKPLVQPETRGIGLGWIIEYLPECDGVVYAHTGGTAGHRAFCGFIPETQTGVVVLSNYGDDFASMFGRYAIDKVGLKVIEMLSI
ncbi:MAG: serine hydrolase domain-containing protein [Jaaginema sp. PMC 1079.18]|nr:serine hydrolase domain-containing protein [Jaaginema sp. PMC 1080.18]MEC4850775.1 serine hydrolase domain-containing protein [Jaaginema sp. PMC 1079.18]MEC4867001.1 serine hydrolase domain-containing protein [Jaaginema sp. PMC 1078.18]